MHTQPHRREAYAALTNYLQAREPTAILMHRLISTIAEMLANDLNVTVTVLHDRIAITRAPATTEPRLRKA